MNIEKTVLFIVNPISGGIDKNDLVASVETALQEKGFQLFVYYTTGENDPGNLENIIRDKNPARVIIAGGDGTIRLAATVLMQYDITIGILPYGSANGFAVNLDLPTDLQEQLDIALGDSVINIDLLDINGHVCMHIADMGLNAELIKNYENSSVRGKIGYMLQSISSLKNSNYPYAFEVEANGKHYHNEGILLAVANASKFGTGANINPKGKLNDGKFELVLFKNFHLLDIIKTLTGHEEVSSDFADTISTDSAKIHCKTPVAFQVDGEYIGEIQDIEVKLASGKLKVAVPTEFVKTHSI